MGQSPSTPAPTKPEIHVVDPPKPEVKIMNPPNLHLRVLDPPTHPPTGLALIAHGQNATIDCPVVGTLATYLRESHGCRTVTWSARGVGKSEGTKGFDSENRKDYNRILEMAMDSLTREFPETTGCRLFICGHEAGAAYAGTIRPPSSPCFDSKTRYILISYSASLLDYSLRGTGYHYSALESLVQSGGLAGGGPPAEVLAITGRQFISGVKALCALWIESKTGKFPGDNLRMEIVEGADRDWRGYYGEITGVTGKWLSQQPRGEVLPPSESASSTVVTDQIPSVPVVVRTMPSRANRFTGQVL